MTGLVLSIAVLATGSILPSAYADTIASNWKLTLENTKSGRTVEFSQGGLPDCNTGANACTIFLSEGQLRKCTNFGNSQIRFSGLNNGDTSTTIQCNGPWELTFTSNPLICTGGPCTVIVLL